MTDISRRAFNAILGSGLALGAAGLPLGSLFAQSKANVVIVGGGFGGATAAKYLKLFNANLSVTLIEPSTSYVTCPFSNTVIGGINSMEYITQNYDALKGMGVTVVHEMATRVDGAKKTVTLSNGNSVAFDRCIVSPGIDFRWDQVVGLDQSTVEAIPHAWKAGSQTILLRKQLEAMRDGGTFIISPPPNPFRCPPGPGERISLVANYFKKHKPKSKIVVLDPKKGFSKQGLFKEGWAKLYKGMIDYHNVDNDGVVEKVDAKTKTLHTNFGQYKGDVVNFIPPQYAGAIARSSGLADNTGWCPVDQRTFESTLVPGVHVIGDASVAAPMPKSGFSASSQAKVCAAAISAMLANEAPGTPKFVNTCYSLVAEDYGISVAMVYGYEGNKIIKVKGSGGLSPSGSSDRFHSSEANYARGWYESITQDIWA